MVQGLIYETLFYFNPLKAPIDQAAGAAAGVELRVERGRHGPDGLGAPGCDLDRRRALHRWRRGLHLQQGQRDDVLNDGGTAPTAEATDDATVVITYAESSYLEGPNALARTWIIPSTSSP